MIFVTVGTHEQPFNRLIRALDVLPPDDLIVQYGFAEAPRGVARAVPFMTFSEMLENFRRADAVITHAGVGSILCATTAGHVPIVVPRLKRHAEHVDDHQVQLIRELAREKEITVLWDVEGLMGAVADVSPRRAPIKHRAGPLHAGVRAAILGASDPVPRIRVARESRSGDDGVEERT